MKKPVRDRAASIRARLRNLARAKGEDYNLTLVRYALERFLYRLGGSPYRGQFILKGAMLYAIWGSETFRRTRDLDLLGYGASDLETVAQRIREICEVPDPEGGIVFSVETVSAKAIRALAEYDGVRVRFSARLGNARLPLQVDVGFGDAVEPAPREIVYPVLLAAPAPRLRAYPMEAVIAEKVEAMVKRGAENSRMKDFYDVDAFAKRFSFKGAALTKALAATFKRRRTEFPAALPVALTPGFYSAADKVNLWRAFISRAGLISAPHDFSEVGSSLRVFLVPVLEALAQGTVFENAWPAGGPWR